MIPAASAPWDFEGSPGPCEGVSQKSWRRLPFTPKFLQINSPPVFFFVFFFCNFYGSSLRPPIFFVTPMCGVFASLGGGLENIFFVILTKLIPRKIFFVLQTFW